MTLSQPNIIITTHNEAPPIRVTKHKFGINDRVIITQGGNGVTFPESDLPQIIQVLTNIGNRNGSC